MGTVFVVKGFKLISIAVLLSLSLIVKTLLDKSSLFRILQK